MKFAWRIREKMLASSILLLIVVSVLSYSSFHGASRFRALTKSIRSRSSELPLAANLSQLVSNLRVTFLRYSMSQQVKNFMGSNPGKVGLSMAGFLEDEISLRQQFLADLEKVNSALSEYESQLEVNLDDARILSDIRRERVTVEEVKNILAYVASDFDQTDWVFSDLNRIALSQNLQRLQDEVTLLPGFLNQRMIAFHEQARSEYKTWMFLSGMMTLLAVCCLGLFALGIYVLILRPLRDLLRGSRLVAKGEYDHRIDVKTNDEVAELAEAMNLMTENFQSIRNDLDEQVRKRTKEVIRSDRLASVGFLAAGVAHEINNPMASIALAAESVEKRFDSAFEEDAAEGEQDPDVNFIRKYLKRIQQESFRCKGITERLLDFSRIGESERKRFDLVKIVQGVIDMVKNLNKYRAKHIEFVSAQPLMAEVNGQEIKQVVMNLLTNALDCVQTNGNVRIEVRRKMGQASIIVKDDGCGMSPDVLEHIFEPFFTKRKHGEGTGLGLSISNQIIADHGGSVLASSEGRGLGSTFEVTLPLTQQWTKPGEIGKESDLNRTGNQDDQKKEKAA